MVSQTELLQVIKQVTDSLAAPEDLDGTLRDITQAIADILTGVDLASVSILDADGKTISVAATDPLATRSDDLQYQYGEGPCLDALITGEDVLVTDLASDPRWPQYGPVAARSGVVAQLALALRSGNKTLGALNLYSLGAEPLDEVSHEIARLFASHAVVALDHSHKLGTLNQAMITRTTIGTAIGLVMQHYGLDEDRAFEFLVRVSQTGNVKLRVVARRMVDEANEAAGLTRPH